MNYNIIMDYNIHYNIHGLYNHGYWQKFHLFELELCFGLTALCFTQVSGLQQFVADSRSIGRFLRN